MQQGDFTPWFDPRGDNTAAPPLDLDRARIPMPGILAIEVHEPGERANELLAAIAAKLHFEQIQTNGRPNEIIHLFVPDHPAAVEAAEAALDDAGDEGRLIVRVLRPS
jgi:hypothetical protein